MATDTVQDDLIQSGMSIAEKVAHRYNIKTPSTITYDELYAEALYVMHTATKTYKPDGGQSWTTYAYERISFGLADFLRTHASMNRNRSGNPRGIRFEFSDNLPVNTDDHDKADYAAPMPDKNAADAEHLATILSILEKLGDPRKSLFLMYLEDVSVAEMSRRFGYCPETIDKLIISIIDHIRSHFLGQKILPCSVPQNTDIQFTAEELAAMRQAWKDGASFAFLAGEYGVSPPTMRNICLHLGTKYGRV